MFLNLEHFFIISRNPLYSITLRPATTSPASPLSLSPTSPIHPPPTPNLPTFTTQPIIKLTPTRLIVHFPHQQNPKIDSESPAPNSFKRGQNTFMFKQCAIGEVLRPRERTNTDECATQPQTSHHRHRSQSATLFPNIALSCTPILFTTATVQSLVYNTYS